MTNLKPRLNISYSGPAIDVCPDPADAGGIVTIGGAFKSLGAWRSGPLAFVVLDNGERPPRRWIVVGPHAELIIAQHDLAVADASLESE